MKHQPTDIYSLLDETTAKLSSGSWPDFLRTAAWTFKYNFVDQALIYAQKKNVTACATFDTWSQRFQRIPRKGTGIALINDRGEKLSLTYVFDISDTFVRNGQKSPSPVWISDETKESAIRTALAAEYLSEHQGPAQNTADFYRSAASAMAEDDLADAIEDLASVRESSSLNEMSESEAEACLRRLVIESVSVMMQYRAALEPEADQKILALASAFDSPEAMSLLGQTTQSIGRRALLEMAKIVKEWDTVHREEIQYENNIPAGRGASDPASEHSAPAQIEQIQPDEEGISQGAQTKSLHAAPIDRQTEPTPMGDREEGRANDPGADGPDGRKDPGAAATGHDSDDLIQESASETGGGADPSRDSIRVSPHGSQGTTEGRKEAGDALYTFLRIYDPHFSEKRLEPHLENIRAYVYENSELARQALLGKLLELNTLAAVRQSSAGQHAISALLEDFSQHVEDPSVLPSALDAGVQNPFPLLAEEQPSLTREMPTPTLPASAAELRTGMVLDLPGGTSYIVAEISSTSVLLEDRTTPLFSQSMPLSTLDTILRNAHETRKRAEEAPAPSVRSESNAKIEGKTVNSSVKENNITPGRAVFENEIDAKTSASTVKIEPLTTPQENLSVKQNSITDIDITALTNQKQIDYSQYSIPTLCSAIAEVFQAQYSAYIENASIEESITAMPEEKFNRYLNGFLLDVKPFRILRITDAQEEALRTPGETGAIMAYTAFRMLESSSPEVSEAGTELISMLQALYQLDEDGLLKTAQRAKREPDAPAVPTAHEEEPSEALTAAKRNYAFLSHFAPAILDGTLDHIQFESSGFEPLYIERIAEDRIAIAHTYTQNGDLMYDPEIVFVLDEEKKELLPLSFQQSMPPIYDTVYEEDYPVLQDKDLQKERSINSFLDTWFQNLSYQGHEPVLGVKYLPEGDKEYYFEAGEMREKLPAHPVLDQASATVHTGWHNITFAPNDVILFGDDDFEVSAVSDGLIHLISLHDGAPGKPANAKQLAGQIQGGGDTKLIPAWKRPNSATLYTREDQTLLRDLLQHFDTYRTTSGVYVVGKYYDEAMDRILNIRISQDVGENRTAILRVAYAIDRFFPKPDHIRQRFQDTSHLLDRADDYLGLYHDFRDMGPSLRLDEWRGGGEEALYEDLCTIIESYHLADDIPAGLVPFLNREQSQDYYDAIPAMTNFIRENKPGLFPDRWNTLHCDGILAAGEDYAGDRDLLYPRRPLQFTPERAEISHESPAVWRRDQEVLADLLDYAVSNRAVVEAGNSDRSVRDADRIGQALDKIQRVAVTQNAENNIANIRLVAGIIRDWFEPLTMQHEQMEHNKRVILEAADKYLETLSYQEIERSYNDKQNDSWNGKQNDNYNDNSDDNFEDRVHGRPPQDPVADHIPLRSPTSADKTNGSSAAASDVKVQAQPMKVDTDRINYHTTDMEPHYGGPKSRFQNNIAAIRLLKQLESEGRLATAEEQEVLHRYVGWGGLQNAFDAADTKWSTEYEELKELLTEEEYEGARASTLTAFYTPPVVIDAIFQGMDKLGISGGNILDAGCGTGAFFGQAPEEAKLYGVEIDSISGRIAQQLYQQAKVAIEGFERTNLPDNFFSAMVGNVPFGNFKVFDSKYNKYNFQIHDYFLAKGLDKLRPGGVMALVTSAGTMDKADPTFRKYLGQRADLIGAIRLPNNTFSENAGTDVTSDILFLRKRARPRVDVPDWASLFLTRDGYSVNRYFAMHPEMVLGDFRKVSGPFGPQLICAPSEEKSLAEGLSEALVNIRDEEPLLLDEIEEPIEDARISIPADPDVANFSYAVVDDKIYFRENDEMFRVELGKTPAARVRGMVELRDTVRELINAQVNDLPDRVIDQLQAQLNDQYNAFTKKFGIINSRGNALAFSDDSSYYLLCSLEQLDKHGNFSGKADIFTKRTISPPRPIHHTDTAYEALVVSIGERGRVDLDLMSRLCGKETKELLQDLEGRIFQDPAHPGSYQLAATYLSGNIREKLREAQVADEKSPGQFTANIQALKDAVPPELGPGEIILKLGATWVPPDVYRDFIYETFKPYAPWQEANLIDVGYSEVLNLWNISGKSLDRNSVAATSTYGTKRMDAYTILENTLNLRDIRIFDVVEVDGVERRVVNAEETILAQEKQQQIREAFGAWVWSDPQRTERLCKIYNEKFNCFKPPEYDGDILTFHGMNSEKQLRKNQKDTIARILFSGNTQVAHAVGAGKTWTMVGAAMEGKYLGLCNKTMIVVPNHLVGQWASDIYDLYPAAKVLAVTKKDFETKNRKKFCGRIATGDYDIIVLGHSQLERIPLSTERQKQFVQDQIDEVMDGIYELEASGEKHFSIKQLERKKKTLERKMEKLTNSKQRDDVISFEELGVDRLFVDESDEFKNLYYTTKMQNVAGLSQADSQKASDLYMKCRYIDELTDNKGNVHATGTPLSNTMAEIYNMQRFLQYDLLKELGLHHFDSWASSFAEVNPVLELAPEGSGYIVRNRLTNFNNLPELLSLYRLVADVQTHETLNLPLPNVHYITRALPPSDAQKKMVQSLAERAEKIRKGSIRPEDDNMLCVVNDGRKLALDQRLMDPTLPDDPDSKVNACAQDVYNQWFEGRTDRLTQLVFCDISTPKPNTFNVYETLRDKLVEKGIPREEICFIHEANTDAKKEELFARVRDGSVRVLMGSTGKMGTGTNVQDLLVAGHDLDVPWRPRDLTQRDGRVIRQGNENDDVYIYRYVTEGTFDAYMYQLLENKQRLIHQIFTSKSPARQMEDIDQMAISFAEIKAIASGNTLVKEKVELQMAISKLELLKARHTNNQASLAKQVKSELPDKIKDTKERISRLTSDVKHLNEINAESSANGRSPIEIEGTTFEKPGEAGEAVLSAIDKLPLNDTHEIGCYRGFKVSAGREEAQSGEMQRTIYLHGTNEYPIPLSDKSAGVMQRLDHFLDKSLPQRLADNQASLEHLERRLAEAKQEIGKPFLYENDLREKVTRMAQLDEQLNLDANKNNLSNEMPKEDLETPSQTNVQPISFEDRIQSAVKRASDQLASLQTKQYEIRH